MKYSIRFFNYEDAPSLFELALISYQELAPWLNWCHENLTISETQQWLRSQQTFKAGQKAYHFAIVDHQDNVCGSCALTQISHSQQCAQIKFWVSSVHTNNGLNSVQRV